MFQYRSQVMVPPFQTPTLWGIAPDELEEFLKLKGLISAKNKSYDNANPKEIIISFSNKLQTIKDFVHLKNEAIRSIFCGIVFLPKGIAYKMQTLSYVIGESRSFINSSFQHLKYFIQPWSENVLNQFYQKIPVYRNSPEELKFWCYREYRKDLPVPILPNIQSEFNSHKEQTPLKEENKTILSFPCPAKFRHKFAKVFTN